MIVEPAHETWLIIIDTNSSNTNNNNNNNNNHGNNKEIYNLMKLCNQYAHIHVYNDTFTLVNVEGWPRASC